LASRQYGVVSRAQLRELGFGRQAIARRLAARRLRLLYPSVYAVGHWALTPESRDLAAVFACGPDALLSHRAAARRHRLLRDARIELTARRAVKSKPGIAVHTTRVVHPEDAVLVDRPGRGYGDDYSPWLVDAPVGELVRVRGAAVTEEGVLAA